MSGPLRIFGSKHHHAKRAEVLHGMPKPPGIRPGARRTAAQPGDYPCHQVGVTGSATVWAADQLGPAGDAVAMQVVQRIGGDVRNLMDLFGLTMFPAVNIVVSPLGGLNDGTGGAYHYGCNGTDIYVDCSTADPRRTLALSVAELSELAQALQGKGWDCGASNGEALSRFHAELAYPGVLDDYATFAAWLDGGRPDWFSQNDMTDLSPVSTGGVLGWLWWLHVCGGYTAQAITQAGEATPQAVYALLGLTSNAYMDFAEACERVWPSASPSGVAVDNPWSDNCQPSPPPPPPPSSGALLALSCDVSAGAYALVPMPDTAGGPLLTQVLALITQLVAAGVTLQEILAMLGVVSSIAQAHKAQARKAS